MRIFYLACEVDYEEYQFSMFRISKIKNITDTSKAYQKNYYIEDFIKFTQTPFAVYRRNYKKSHRDKT